jgi:hypothetical protein
MLNNCRNKGVFFFSLKIWLATLILGFVLAPGLGLALTFNVINLTENSDLPFNSNSLNSLGVVGATVGFEDFFLIDKAGNISNLTQSMFTTVGAGSINDNGEVAFIGDGDVYFYDGSKFQNLTNGLFSDPNMLGRALNNLGQIAFITPSDPPSELIFFDGMQFIPITAGTDIAARAPALNNNGQMAFLGITSIPSRADMFLFDGTSILNLSIDPNLQITDVNGSPSINDSGKVLFTANTTLSPNNLFLFDGTKTINLTIMFGLPSPAGDIALNNNDQLAFTAVSSVWFFDFDNEQVVQVATAGFGLYMNDSAEMVFTTIDPTTGEIDIFLASPIQDVVIDIRPKSDANKIDPNSKGKIAVAIVTTNGFDAGNVDLNTVRFGATGTEASPIVIVKRDFDRDKDRDLLLFFEIRDTEIECGDTSATLTGQTLDGLPIIGSSPIRTVNCRNHKGPRHHNSKKRHDFEGTHHDFHRSETRQRLNNN